MHLFLNIGIYSLYKKHIPYIRNIIFKIKRLWDNTLKYLKIQEKT